MRALAFLTLGTVALFAFACADAVDEAPPVRDGLHTDANDAGKLADAATSSSSSGTAVVDSGLGTNFPAENSPPEGRVGQQTEDTGCNGAGRGSFPGGVAVALVGLALVSARRRRCT